MRLLYIVSPLLVLLSAGLVYALVLPACALAPYVWFVDEGRCPAETPVLRSSLREEADRTRYLKSEISNLERQLFAMAHCPLPQPEVAPEDRGSFIDPDQWDENDLSLLGGCWNLYSQDYKLKLEGVAELLDVDKWRLCFPPDGGVGEQELRWSDGTECRAPIRAEFEEDGVLGLYDEQDLACSDGAILYERKITCRLGPDRLAHCVVRSGINAQANIRLRREQ